MAGTSQYLTVRIKSTGRLSDMTQLYSKIVLRWHPMQNCSAGTPCNTSLHACSIAPDSDRSAVIRSRDPTSSLIYHTRGCETENHEVRPLPHTCTVDIKGWVQAPHCLSTLKTVLSSGASPPYEHAHTYETCTSTRITRTLIRMTRTSTRMTCTLIHLVYTYLRL